VAVSEKKVQRRMFGPKREEGTGEWRGLYNEELRNSFSSPNIFRVMKPRTLRFSCNKRG
jgi:hypothetical protein